MLNVGVKEVIIIALILFLLFGAKRVPHMARSVVNGIKEFNGLFGK